jgi:hypothetical protein
MQLSFPFAPVSRANKAPVTKPATTRVEGLTVAEALNRGTKVDFPKNANAVRVTIGNKTTVILKADTDTLKGAGVATAVEFGTVKNDAKGHPIRKGFAALKAVNERDLVGGVLVLSLQ